MSYALDLTDRAVEQLQTLDIWLQEEALDELDRIAAGEQSLSEKVGTVVDDFVRVREGKKFYVFFTISVDASSRTIRVKQVGTHVRPL